MKAGKKTRNVFDQRERMMTGKERLMDEMKHRLSKPTGRKRHSLSG